MSEARKIIYDLQTKYGHKEKPPHELDEFIEKEKYLYKIARRVLKWTGVKYKENELADLVMRELFNL